LRRKAGESDLHVLILGGSNSGPKNGWAAQLAGFAPEHRIENKFLGAVGSLFGLLRLLKMRRDGDARPDVVIFEYTLNDTLWLAGRNIDFDLVEDTLHDVATLCAQEGIKLLFLCLCQRPLEAEGQTELSFFMDQFYRRIALGRGAADCLLLGDIMGRVAQSQYADIVHIDLDTSTKVAAAVAARLKEPVPVPRGAKRDMRFRYLDAHSAWVQGAGRLTAHKSTVFEGPFLVLRRGGKCVFEFRGRVAALLLRSTQASGWYKITSGDRMLRKNAQSLARDNVPNLVTLHYLAGAMPDASRVVIEMPESEEALMALPDDLTLMEGPALVPFEEQTLEIAGIMVRQPSSPARRAFDALFAL
jgi:hypothetical protein